MNDAVAGLNVGLHNRRVVDLHAAHGVDAHVLPLRVVAFCNLTTWSDVTLSATTWYFSTATSFCGSRLQQRFDGAGRKSANACRSAKR
jgi:hypothetical protein